MVHAMALRLALDKNAPFILAGFTLGQIPANGIVYCNNYRFLEDGRKRSLDALRASVGPEVDDYYRIPDEILNRVTDSPHNVNLMCLESATEAEIISEIEKLGWRRPRDVDGCSTNCRLNTLNNVVHERLYGYSPYELELSHLIRQGLMSRDEALAKVGVPPIDDVTAIANQLELSEDELQRFGIG
jgi:hypothetical protein